MPTVHANGIDIYYEIEGAGRPLVLIAGLSYTHWQWHRMAPELAEHFQVILFDNRGVGQTDAPPGPYSAQMLADDTAGLLEALGIEQAAVMGHSMGGYVAQALAIACPELLDALILASTDFGGPNRVPITPEVMAMLTDPSGDMVERFQRGVKVSTAPGFAENNPDLIERFLAYRANHPVEPGAYQAQLAVGLSLIPEEAAFEERLPAVEIPTLILFGAHDHVVPPANAELLADRLPNGRIEILPDAGHFFPIETPDAAVRTIVDFLEE